MTFDPSNTLRFDQVFFPPNLVAIGHFYAIWPLLDPRWPLHDFWTQQCTTLWSGVLLTKFGSHRAFPRRIDSFMTYDPRWGCFENMPTNLVGPSPSPMPTFSVIPQSMTKCIVGHLWRSASILELPKMTPRCPLTPNSWTPQLSPPPQPDDHCIEILQKSINVYSRRSILWF